jgi:hypothetical protein
VDETVFAEMVRTRDDLPAQFRADVGRAQRRSRDYLRDRCRRARAFASRMRCSNCR